MRKALPLLLLALACETDVPDADSGRRVSGMVTYGGTSYMSYARPAVIVALFAEFPPMSPPRGIITLEAPDFSQPIAYEIVGVPPGAYKIVGQVIDLTEAMPSSMTTATGSFPNFCILFAPVKNITIAEDAARDGVDFTIYDPGRDPCLRPAADAAVPDAVPAADASPDAT